MAKTGVIAHPYSKPAIKTEVKNPQPPPRRHARRARRWAIFARAKTTTHKTCATVQPHPAGRAARAHHGLGFPP